MQGPKVVWPWAVRLDCQSRPCSNYQGGPCNYMILNTSGCDVVCVWNYYHHNNIMLTINNYYLKLVVLVGGVNCEVSLNSTFTNGSQVHHGDTLIFNCIIRGSFALAWRSNEYIGPNGQQLSLSLSGSTSSLNSYAIATLTRNYIEDDQTVLESTLTIIVQRNIPSASVTCYSLGTDESKTISFQLAGKFGGFIDTNVMVFILVFIHNYREPIRFVWQSISMSWRYSYFHM